MPTAPDHPVRGSGKPATGAGAPLQKRNACRRGTFSGVGIRAEVDLLEVIAAGTLTIVGSSGPHRSPVDRADWRAGLLSRSAAGPAAGRRGVRIPRQRTRALPREDRPRSELHRTAANVAVLNKYRVSTRLSIARCAGRRYLGTRI